MEEAGGKIAEDNKKEKVGETNEITVYRQTLLCGLTNIEYLLRKLSFTDYEKGRVKSTFALMENHGVESFKRSEEQAKGQVEDNYKINFLNNFPLCYDIYKNKKL